MSILSRMLALLVASALPCCTVSTAAQSPANGLRDFMTGELGLTPSDFAAVARGEIVVKSLPTGDQRDVAVIGVVRTAGRVRESSAPARGTDHVFAEPAALGDVQGFRLTRDDIDELRRCRPSSCNFKLPASGMEALRAVIDSSGADAADRGTAYVQQRVVDYVDAYRDRGSAAMLVYDDLGSVQSRDAFDAMVRDSSRIFQLAPRLARYLDAYPREPLAGATSTIVWSVSAMAHLRPVLRVMHLVEYSPADDRDTRFVVAKQLYADHYFEAGLEALVLADAAKAGMEFPDGTGGTVALAVRRYRFDHLPSGGMLNVRGRVLGGLRGAVTEDLRNLRDEASRLSRGEP